MRQKRNTGKNGTRLKDFFRFFKGLKINFRLTYPEKQHAGKSVAVIIIGEKQKN